MNDTLHIIGNGPSATLYKQKSHGRKLTCNIPHIPIPDAYATVMVDFKMMNAINKDGVIPPQPWVLGWRPKQYMQKHQAFYMKNAHIIREFYTTLPKYVAGYTDFNCGHVATHYGLNKFKPDTVHMYGFDSMFNFDLSSATDFYLESDRGDHNNTRLTNNWRRVWHSMFNEFSDVNFILHMDGHDKLKFPKGSNVEIKIC